MQRCLNDETAWVSNSVIMKVKLVSLAVFLRASMPSTSMSIPTHGPRPGSLSDQRWSFCIHTIAPHWGWSKDRPWPCTMPGSIRNSRAPLSAGIGSPQCPHAPNMQYRTLSSSLVSYKHSSCNSHHISAPCPHRIYDCTRNLAPGSHHWVAHFRRSNNQNAELRHSWNLARHNIQCIWKHRKHLCISLNIHLHVLVNHYMVGVRTLSNFLPSIFGCGKSLGNVPMPQLSSSL